MDIINILNEKSIKAMDKRTLIVEAIKTGVVDMNEVKDVSEKIDEKKIAIIMEALEEITRYTPDMATLNWLLFAEQYIDAASNSLKRESSRVVGNIAHLFEDNLTVSIQKLLGNTTDEGTVVRWGSAYALSRIIVLPSYSKSKLYDTLTKLRDLESENGVKNQYIKSLKKAEKQRSIFNCFSENHLNDNP